MAGAEEEEVERRFLLLYGSQTGQAKAIAERIEEIALELGFKPDIHCFSQSEKKFDLTREKIVVIVVSTTGDGEAPDTVSRVWRRLKKKTLPSNHLGHLQYGLLGLGDTNYNNFCNMGKNLHRRLQELGACPFTEPGWADDGVGLELVVEPWIEDLWEPLESTLESLQSNSITHHEGGGGGGEGDDEPSVKIVSGPDCIQIVNGVEEVKITDPDCSVNLENTNSTIKITDTACSVNSENTEKASTDVEITNSVNSEITNSDSPSSTATPKVGVVLPAPPTLSDVEIELRGGGGKIVGENVLSLPTIPPPSLSVNISEEVLEKEAEFRYHDVEYTYSRTGGVVMATVVGCRWLTREGALRHTIELQLHLPESEAFSYEPGDAVSFVCPNSPLEVDLILERLGLMSCADHMIQLSTTTNTQTGKSPSLPRHIPSVCSVRQYFTFCSDFRAIPKKVMLAYLSSCCGNQEDRRRLVELSSRECAGQYREVVLGKHVDLLDVLFNFPSCLPSLDRLIQFLPRLKPRLYSIASSPLSSPNTICIALSLLSLPHRTWWNNTDGRGNRQGLASGYFNSIAKHFPQATDKIFRVPVAPRNINTFRLPDDPSTPLIMIGPGTGVAPFLGFLEHRRARRRRGNGTTLTGKAWLFFGCRHPNLDHLYREELERFVSDQTLARLTVCFSRLEEARRSEGEGKYVQDGMVKYGGELAQWVMEEGAAIYVCGEARGMARDVEVTWTSILSQYVTDRQRKDGVGEGGEGGGGGGGGGSGEGGGGGGGGGGGEKKEGEGGGGGGSGGGGGEKKEGGGGGESIIRELKDTARYLIDAWSF